MRPAQDLLHMLARDHRRLDARCRSLIIEPARRTRQALEAFGSDVLAHEASEQLLLHPLVIGRLPGGSRLARHRTDEEDVLARLLGSSLLEEPSSSALGSRLTAFHRAFVEHADREELEVFPPLRHAVDRRQLRELGQAYASLAVRLPTRLRCAAAAAAGNGGGTRLLAGARQVASEILQELDVTTTISLLDPIGTADPGAAPPVSTALLGGT